MSDPKRGPADERFAKAIRLADDFRQQQAAGHAPPLADFLREHADVRRQLEPLLADATVVPSAAPSADAPTTQTPTTIGPYRIVSRLGAGGMGTVYLAERHDPEQRVALKVIRRGLDSERLVTHFQHERQALARMNHDAIAKVFDAGTTADGEPYFVMELVEHGTPLTTFCDALALPIRERIALFQQVCAGVQHAHLKGVVHRDLKPGNVLVAAQGSRHAVKIIDFGIASPLEVASVGDSAQRRPVGTPEYMSPEQAAGDPKYIDSRTDVYSLGVMLFELLTGELPFGSDKLRELPTVALQQHLRDSETPRPSTRITTSGEQATTSAAARGLSVAALAKTVRGDLDWIVLQAMAKEPTHRYATPNDLALDLQRHLANEPVRAVPGSAGYRLQKLVRRHRGAVLAATAVWVTAIAGAGFVLNYARIAGENEKLANARADDNAKLAEANAVLASAEAKGRADALRLQARAMHEARLSEETLDVMLRMFKAQEPNQARGEVLTVTAALDQNLERVLGLFHSEPRPRARLLRGIGELYQAAGATAKAVPLLEESYALLSAEPNDPADPERWRSAMALGTVRLDQGLDEQARVLFSMATTDLMRVLGPEHDDTLAARVDLGLALHRLRRFEEALAQTEAVLAGKFGRLDHATISALNTRGLVLLQQGAFEQAVGLFTDVHERFVEALGADSEDAIVSMGNLAVAHQGNGTLDRAEELLVEAIPRAEHVLGSEHLETLKLLGFRGSLLVARDRCAEAADTLGVALLRSQAARGNAHKETLRLAMLLATALDRSGRSAEVEPLLVDSLYLARTNLRANDPLTGALLQSLAWLYEGSGRLPDALTHVDEALLCRRQANSDEHPDVLTSRASKGSILIKLQRLPEAEAILRDTFETSRRVRGPQSVDTLVVQLDFAIAVFRQGRRDEARTILREGLEAVKGTANEQHPYVQSLRDALEFLERAATSGR